MTVSASSSKRHAALDLGPLERVLRLWKSRGGVLEPGDFAYLGSYEQSDVTIHVYKHRISRRCINIDEWGHAYAFAPDARQLDEGEYRPLDSLAAGLSRLEELRADEPPT